jgi:hypothetical protein
MKLTGQPLESGRQTYERRQNGGGEGKSACEEDERRRRVPIVLL